MYDALAWLTCLHCDGFCQLSVWWIITVGFQPSQNIIVRIHLLWRPGHLTLWTLTPEFWLPDPHLILDAPDIWRWPFDARVAFDAPITPGWHLTPQYPWVAFDAPITPGWHLTPGTIFQIFDCTCIEVCTIFLFSFGSLFGSPFGSSFGSLFDAHVSFDSPIIPRWHLTLQ